MPRPILGGFLDIRRSMIAAAPFWLAAAATHDLHGQVTATDVASLRAHIAAANGSVNDHTINVAAGTYTLTGAPDGASPDPNSGDLDITKSSGSLTIEGAGAASTIIDGDFLDRVFHIAGSTGGSITIRNLTIRNGRATDDGGLGSAQPEARGGGIYNESGTNLTLEGVVFSGNGATGLDGFTIGVGRFGGSARGAGLYNAGGVLNISGCTFSGNSAAGGIGWTGTLSAPSSEGGAAEGAGLYIVTGTVTIAASTFSGNTAVAGPGGQGHQSLLPGGPGGTGRGAGVFIAAGGLELTACTLDNNAATGGTGGKGGNGPIGYFSGVFAGAGYTGGAAAGGGLYAGAGTIVLQNCTVSGNSATGGTGGDGGRGGDASAPSTGIGGGGGDAGAGANADGGGIFAGGGSLTLLNCTVAANSTTAGAAGTPGGGGIGPGGTFGPGQANTAGSDSGGGLRAGGTVILTSTLVANNAATSGPDAGGAITVTASLIEDPSGATVTGTPLTGDPGLGVLAGNGGPTRTHAITAASIAHNAGANPAGLATDQRGTGFPRVRDGSADIGAFEVQAGSGGGPGPGPGPGPGGSSGGGRGGGGCVTHESRGWEALLVALASVVFWIGRSFLPRRPDCRTR